MKRHLDTEGRPESAGPLFDCLVPPTRKHSPDSREGRSVKRMPEIPQAVAEQRRDAGMAQTLSAAGRHAPGWEDDAIEAVREFARHHEHFPTEDVRAVAGTPEGVDGRAWGPILRRCAALGIVEADGFVLANSSNRSPKVRWRSLVFAEPRP